MAPLLPSQPAIARPKPAAVTVKTSLPEAIADEQHQEPPGRQIADSKNRLALMG